MSLALSFGEQVKKASEIAMLIFDYEETSSNARKKMPRVTLQHCKIIDPALLTRRDELWTDPANWVPVEGRRYQRRLRDDVSETVRDACASACEVGGTHEEALSKLFKRMSVPGRIVQRDDDPESDVLVAVSRFIFKGRDWKKLDK